VNKIFDRGGGYFGRSNESELSGGKMEESATQSHREVVTPQRGGKLGLIAKGQNAD